MIFSVARHAASLPFYILHTYVRTCARMCGCVCVCARARTCAYVCMSLFNIEFVMIIMNAEMEQVMVGTVITCFKTF